MKFLFEKLSQFRKSGGQALGLQRPHRPPSGAGILDSPASQLIGTHGTKPLPRIFELVCGLARELSDETAYQRHLQLTGHAHSAAEWRAFSDSRHRRRYRDAKCC